MCVKDPVHGGLREGSRPVGELHGDADGRGAHRVANLVVVPVHGLSEGKREIDRGNAA